MTATVAVSNPWRYRPYRMLLAGRTTSVLGNAVAPVALAFAVLDLTGSVTSLGLVLAARSIANVALLLFGGVYADRLPRGVLLTGSAVAAACSQGLVALSLFTGIASVALLAGLGAVNGAVAAMSQPASAALTPQTVGPESLTRANALLRVGTNTASIAGVAVGGLIVAAIGPAWGIAIDAGSFAIAAVLFGRIGHLAEKTPAARERVFAALRVGWSEVTSRQWVWVVIVQFTLLNCAFVGAVTVLGPVVADRSFGRAAWGLVLASETAGLLLGALVALRWQPRRALRWGVLCMFCAAGAPLALATASNPVLLAVVFFACGIGIEQFSVAWDVSLQQNVPADRLARVYSYDMLGSFVAIPAGEAATGPIAAHAGVSATLCGCAAVIGAVTLAALATPGVRQLRRRTSPAR